LLLRNTPKSTWLLLLLLFVLLRIERFPECICRVSEDTYKPNTFVAFGKVLVDPCTPDEIVHEIYQQAIHQDKIIEMNWKQEKANAVIANAKDEHLAVMHGQSPAYAILHDPMFASTRDQLYTILKTAVTNATPPNKKILRNLHGWLLDAGCSMRVA
jgi:hypothetical protein